MQEKILRKAPGDRLLIKTTHDKSGEIYHNKVCSFRQLDGFFPVRRIFRFKTTPSFFYEILSPSLHDIRYPKYFQSAAGKVCRFIVPQTLVPISRY